MRLAIDTSVILSILKGEPTGSAWLDLLIKHRSAGDRLLICPVVYAELSPFMKNREELDEMLARLGCSYDEITQQSSWKAGEVFAHYRKNGGPRVHLIPDFLIASHALRQCEALAAIDRGYLRTYFADLMIMHPAPE